MNSTSTEKGELCAAWDSEMPESSDGHHERRKLKDQLHKSIGACYFWTDVAGTQRCIKQRKSFSELALSRIEVAG